MKALIRNPFLWAVLVIVAVQISVPVALWYFIGDSEKQGQFGDMFGVANSLFSGLAFAGLIYTILLQRRELQLQREELKMTREQLRRSAAAQEASEKALAEQAKAMRVTAELATIETLLSEYRREMDILNGFSRSFGDKTERMTLLEGRGNTLYKRLDFLYQELIELGDQAGERELDDHAVSE